MAPNIIAKSVIFNWILNLFSILILIHYQFELTDRAFSILLLVNLVLMSLYGGASAKKNRASPAVNGLCVGVLSAAMIFLSVSSVADMNWNVNIFILCAWMFVGFIFGGVGGSLTKARSYAK